jgi:hypothetical protein
MNMKKRSAVAVALSALLTTGCLDLDVVANQASPTAEQVLSDANELQLVVAGTWSTVWHYMQHNPSSFFAMGAIGHEWVSGNATLLNSTFTEPRTSYPNDYALSSRFVSQNPWYAMYEGIDNATQALKIIEKDGMRLMLMDEGETTPSDKTDRARAFAYYTQGVLYGMFALTYDQASVSLHTTDRSKPDWWHYQPYTEIAKVAIGQLQKTIEVAQTAQPFVIPGTWTGGTEINNALLVEMAHYHIARIMAYLPRTPAERRDISAGGIVDWQKVIDHADKAIKQDFIVTLASTGRVAEHVRYHNSQGITVTDPRVYGPADISGAYADWIAKPVSERNRFLVRTHDRRITGATATGEPNPTSNGTYLRYTATCCGATWQSYMFGHYVWHRMGGRFNTGTKVHLAVDEMRLLKAEAHLRRGSLQAAADLINVTRVNNGKLPPVTVSGVPGGMDSCVPRTYDGKACGTLLDALHHERVIELLGLHNFRSWWDRRGFGTLAPGTYTQLPIPVRELQALGNAFYTTGGAAGSAADGILQVR